VRVQAWLPAKMLHQEGPFSEPDQNRHAFKALFSAMSLLVLVLLGSEGRRRLCAQSRSCAIWACLNGVSCRCTSKVNRSLLDVTGCISPGHPPWNPLDSGKNNFADFNICANNGPWANSSKERPQISKMLCPFVGP
jgi:hypothetical protein